jgi:hypothetical protein
VRTRRFPRPLALTIAWRLKSAGTFRVARASRRCFLVAPAAARLVAIAEQLLAKPASAFVARNVEALARIAVRTAWTPIASAVLPLGVACRARELLLLLRLPETAAREPSQHGVGMARLQLLQRRQQLFLRVRAERGRLPFQNDRPVGMSWGHGVQPSLEPSCGSRAVQENPFNDAFAARAASAFR